MHFQAVFSIRDFHFSCPDIFPNASKLFSNNPDGGVERLLVNSHLGKASEIFLPFGPAQCHSLHEWRRSGQALTVGKVLDSRWCGLCVVPKVCRFTYYN